MIGLGDLLVFVAVVLIVALFLRVVYTFISADEQGQEPAATPCQQEHETRRKPPVESERITESQSVSK